MWELPLVRALSYHHCVLAANDEWTVPIGGKAELAVKMNDQYQGLAEAARAMSDEDEDDLIDDDEFSDF